MKDTFALNTKEKSKATGNWRGPGTPRAPSPSGDAGPEWTRSRRPAPPRTRVPLAGRAAIQRPQSEPHNFAAAGPKVGPGARARERRAGSPGGARLAPGPPPARDAGSSEGARPPALPPSPHGSPPPPPPPPRSSWADTGVPAPSPPPSGKPPVPAAPYLRPPYSAPQSAESRRPRRRCRRSARPGVRGRADAILAPVGSDVGRLPPRTWEPAPPAPSPRAATPGRAGPRPPDAHARKTPGRCGRDPGTRCRPSDSRWSGPTSGDTADSGGQRPRLATTSLTSPRGLNFARLKVTTGIRSLWREKKKWAYP